MSSAGSAGRGWGRQSCRESSCAPLWSQPTPRSAKASSVTAHCHAATALPTREYQSDYRRFPLTPASTCATCTHEQPCPLDKPFHIRSAQRACARSSDWRRGAAGSPDPYELQGPSRTTSRPDLYTLNEINITRFRRRGRPRSTGSPGGRLESGRGICWW
jgi:hypothetical protein